MTTELEETSTRIDGLLTELDGMGDLVSDRVAQLVRLITDLYGEGLRRALAAEPGLARRLAADPLVAGLLVLHGLHPDAMEERLRAGLTEASAALRPAGARVRRVAVDEALGRVEIGITGPAGSGGATRQRWAETVRNTLVATVPDAVVDVRVTVPLPVSAIPAPPAVEAPVAVPVALGTARTPSAGLAAR